jgi:elongation factor 1-gamma
VGDKITLADLTLASAIRWALSLTLDKKQSSKYPNVVKHLELISKEPSVKELFGETEYIEKAIKYEPKK